MVTIEDKILGYMREHKKPVTIKQMTKYFIVNEKSAQRALASLVDRGIAEVVPKSKPFLYGIKR
jgi:predicted DNA-binding transcriptional regulator YafY